MRWRRPRLCQETQLCRRLVVANSKDDINKSTKKYVVGSATRRKLSTTTQSKEADEYIGTKHSSSNTMMTTVGASFLM
jgi:hypothetical protein